MKPTKMMPYIVVIEDVPLKKFALYAFRTERQAKRFHDGVQVGTNYKVGMYVSILKAKRGAK